MNYLIHQLKQFPVTFGNLTVYLSGYQLSETSTVQEAGTSAGNPVLSACWNHGSRLKLTGKISSQQSVSSLIAVLSQNMLTRQTLTLENLQFVNAMLCSYSVTEQQETPEVILLFYCPESPVIPEETES